MFYNLLKAYCRITLKFYFGQWQIEGKDNIPDGPVILVSNHQNAFLDAVLVICSCSKNPWAFTRADIFKSSFAKKLLTLLKMIPIFRFRDGYATLKNNQTLIDDCVIKLNSGQSVLIFSEGSHSDKMQLRPLQKGFVKLSFLTENKLNIPVIPVGIQYYFKGSYKSRVLVNFGKPIYTNLLKKSHYNDEKKYTESLLNSIKSSMESLIVHIEDPEYEQKFNYLINNRRYHKNLLFQLQNDTAIVKKYPIALPQKPIDVKPGFLAQLNSSFSKINLLIPSGLIKFIIRKTVSDPQFIPSLNYGAGSFITPVYLLMAGLIISLISHNTVYGVLYVLVVIISTGLRRV